MHLDDVSGEVTCKQDFVMAVYGGRSVEKQGTSKRNHKNAVNVNDTSVTDVKKTTRGDDGHNELFSNYFKSLLLQMFILIFLIMNNYYSKFSFF